MKGIQTQVKSSHGLTVDYKGGIFFMPNIILDVHTLLVNKMFVFPLF